MSTGVKQRHRKGCDQAGRCRCPWSFHAEVRRAVDGTRRQLTRSGFASQKDAKNARAAAIKAATATAAPTATARATVATRLRTWLDGREAADAITASTLATYRDNIERFIVPAIGRVRLTDLSTAHVTELFVSIRRDHPDLSPATVRNIYATLRAGLRSVIDAGITPGNPFAEVELPRLRQVRHVIWQPEQFGAFIDHPHVASHRLAVAVLLAAYGGLRRGEVAGLRWADVDLDRARLTVRQQAIRQRTRRPDGTGYTSTLTYTAPKSDAGADRVVDLDADTVAALRSWRATQAADRLAWGEAWTDTGLVVTHSDGRGWDPSNLGKAFTRMTERARFVGTEPVSPGEDGWDDAEPLPHVRFHDLRHLSASLHLAAGTPMAMVSKRLGHASIALTVDLYGHVLDGIGAQAAQAAADLVPRRSRGA